MIESILIPTGIVTAMGLLCGVLLSIASKVFFVPTDETADKIREQLPGANCGGCGYAGCDDYAAALAADHDLNCTLCAVGGPGVAEKIAGILGVDAGAGSPKVAMVMCKGNYGVTKKIMEVDRIDSCKEASMFYGGQWACPYGCLGLGDCAKACKFGAISVRNGVAHVDREKCVACGACVAACPHHIVSLVDKNNKVFVTCKSMEPGGKTRTICKNGCIGCKKCEKACKFDAIHVVDNFAHIDYEKCKSCGMCAKECPTGALVNIRKPHGAAEK